ncbi:MAG: vanadium-dependent haloperoxidase [Candidatus Eremiobacteraeota bacterium]|nr:vanadium-dependent haloperoxidase [Candidatus Eremiobacteraeota bacterium]
MDRFLRAHLPGGAAAVLLASSLLLAGCGGGGGTSSSALPPTTSNPPAAPGAETLVMQWDDQLFTAIRADKPAPTVVARSLGVLHEAMYEAWTAYDSTAVGEQVGNALRRPSSEATYANKAKAISYAAYRAAVDLFPDFKSTFDAFMQSLNYDPTDIGTDISTPQGIGNVAAAAILNYRHQDGSNQQNGYADTTGYKTVNPPLDLVDPGAPSITAVDPSRWQPLIVFNPNGSGTTITQKWATPQWYTVKPFALTSGSQFRPPPPPAFGSPDYIAAAQELINYNGSLTDYQKASAAYWADGPNSELPPGHWCLFGKFISQRDNHTLDDDVKMMFILANAEFDTSIAVWDTKRAYDSSRPVTAIRQLFQGQTVMGYVPGKGPQMIPATQWWPYQQMTVGTPPFAEYVSGHSGFSAAGAEVLRRWTGSDTLNATYTMMAGTSKINPGVDPATNVNMSWATFTDAANDAAMSRRYGGIHFSFGDLGGRTIGTSVADVVWSKAYTYINGTASVPGGQAVVRRYATIRH